MKANKETLEEAAEKYAESKSRNFKTTHVRDFTAGAKWQQKRMYEIMDSYVDDVMGGCNLRAKDWFKNFKKK